MIRIKTKLLVIPLAILLLLAGCAHFETLKANVDNITPEEVEETANTAADTVKNAINTGFGAIKGIFKQIDNVIGVLGDLINIGTTTAGVLGASA